VPFAGVLADSVRSLRRLLVTVDLLQALIVAAVPVTWTLSLLSLPFLFAVAAASGGMGGVTGVAIRAVAARSVAAADAMAGNSAITGARTVGQLTGPALAGWLIQILGAVTAVAADAASYVTSALILLRLPATRAPRPGERVGRPGLRSLREGFAILRARPALFRIAIAGASLNLGGAAIGALYVLYAFRVLGLTPAALGAIMVIQNGAAILAVTTATRVARRIGLERIVPVFAPIAGASLFLIPAASLLPPLAALAAYGLVFGYCTTVWTIGSASLQQILVPPGQIGRVAALSSSIGLVVIPVGAATGGVLANAWGIEPTLLLAAATTLSGAMAVAVGPLPG
jgi:predicted MFS family arabinose efflux permease